MISRRLESSLDESVSFNFQYFGLTVSIDFRGQFFTIHRVLYSHLHHHSASKRHNIKDRRMNKRRRKEDARRLL